MKNPYNNLWQNPVWAKFQEAAGRKVWQLSVTGASALVIRHALPLGLCWLEVPRGPLFLDEASLDKIFGEIRVLAKKEGAIFVRVSSYCKFRTQDSGLRLALHDHQPETSLVLNLSLSEDELLAQMKPKGRYNIKVAQKEGVEVLASDKVGAFHDLLVKTGGRDGFGIHPKSYYEKMLTSLGDKAQLLLAHHEGRVIAGGIFVYLEEWGIYYYGASDHEARNLMAPYLIQWKAITEAKRQGCKFYDFLGIAPENVEGHAWAGVTEFKKKFGGKVVNYPKAKEMVVRPMWYWLYRRVKG